MSANPLPCVILHSSEDSTLHSYSINGCLLNNINISPETLIFPTIVHNSLFNDFLIYIDKTDNAIVIRELPNLKKTNKKYFDKHINAFVMSSNSMFGVLGHEDGSCSSIYPSSKDSN
jgi:hypothetical protein